MLRHIVSVAMALLVLFSTMSFTVDMHFCGDHLVDLAFFDDAKTCGMDTANSLEADTMMAMEMDCCTDLEFVLEGQEDLNISLDNFSFEHQNFITAFTYTYLNLFEDVSENSIPFRDYSPPPLIRDIVVLDQTFII